MMIFSHDSALTLGAFTPCFTSAGLDTACTVYTILPTLFFMLLPKFSKQATNHLLALYIDTYITYTILNLFPIRSGLDWYLSISVEWRLFYMVLYIATTCDLFCTETMV